MNTPPLVHLLAQSCHGAITRELIDAAHLIAAQIIAQPTTKDRTTEIDRWVQRAAETGTCGTELKAMHDYQQSGGTVQSAFMEPSFALGFVLAAVLLNDNGGPR
jgi:hypothetical protein